MKNEEKPPFPYVLYGLGMLTVSWMSWLLYRQQLDAGYWAGLFATSAVGTAIGYAWGRRDSRRDAKVRSSIERLIKDDELMAFQINARLADNGIDYPTHATYTLLRSMEQDGVLTSREALGGPERGGRPRRLYSAQGGARTLDHRGD